MKEKNRKIRIRVAALIVKDGKILLAEHEKGGKRYWLLPGGGVEYGETLTEALERELQEEAGLEIRVRDLLWTLDSVPPDKHRHVLNLVFEAEALSDTIRSTTEKVLKGVAWRSIGEVTDLVLYPDMREEILRFLREGIRGAVNLGKRWDP